MKKLIAILSALVVLCCSFAGCGSDSGKDTDDKAAFTGTAQEVLDALIAKAISIDTDKEYGIGSIECTDTPVDADSCTDILGLTTDEFNSMVESAVESKPDGSWWKHSVVVIKVKPGTDTAALADKIVKGTKPDRFGCLKAGMIVGEYAGEYILLVVSDEALCEVVISAFEQLSAVKPVKISRTNDWSDGGFFG